MTEEEFDTMNRESFAKHMAANDSICAANAAALKRSLELEAAIEKQIAANDASIAASKAIIAMCSVLMDRFGK